MTRLRICSLFFLFLALAVSTATSAAYGATTPAAFLAASGARLSKTHVSWTTDINGFRSTLRTRFTSVLPGHTVRIQSSQPIQIQAPAGSLHQEAPGTWNWTAPSKPSHYTLDLLPPNGDYTQKIILNVFVLVPAAEVQNGRLRGFPIGHYRDGDGAYARPQGFIEVTSENQQTWVSPHFQLKQFVCKQAGPFPKYMLLSEALVVKLEMILERLNQSGFPANTLAVLSGFRTPAYNRKFSRASNSRHTYGDAADVFVDNNHDGRMDDLNRDGRSNAKDARIFARIVEQLESELQGLVPVGGMGMYKNTHNHGPFIHVDARGFVARWASS